MGAHQSTEEFLPASDFSDELADYLLDAPMRSASDLLLTVHFATGINSNLSGLAAVFTRQSIKEADDLLGTLAKLKVTSPLFPKDLVFRQPPKVKRYEAIWIVEGRGKLQIFEKYFRKFYKTRGNFAVPQTGTKPVSAQLIESGSQAIQLVTFKGQNLREFNQFLKETLEWLRFRHTYIQSILDVGMSSLENGTYLAWVKSEHFTESLESEVLKRKTNREPFTDQELLTLLHQLSHSLRYLQETACVGLPRVSPSHIWTASPGVHKVALGVPWLERPPQTSNSGLTELGETLLYAASLEESRTVADIHALPYSNQLKELIFRLIHNETTLKEVETQASEMGFMQQLAPFESQIMSYLSPVILRTREQIGRYCLPPQKHFSVDFYPLQFILGGYYIGERNWLRQRHGRGILIGWRGEYLYEGVFEYGEMSGIGRSIYNNGVYGEGAGYEAGYLHYIDVSGDWTTERDYCNSDSEEVYGVMKHQYGDVYEGTIVSNQRNGWGILTTADMSYEGEWKDDFFDGKGRAIYTVGGEYEGMWKAGRRNGKGRNIYPGNWDYTGEWLDDQMHGEGTLISPSGDTFIGKWEYSNMVGRAVVLHSNGEREEVNFP